MSTFPLFLTVLAGILLFFLFLNLQWLVRTIRDIASPANHGGYTKLIQMTLIALLCLTFVAIVVYYLKTPEKVDRIDLILTVVVGWLGIIIGQFFGEQSMSVVDEQRKLNLRRAKFLLDEYHSVMSLLHKKLQRK